MGSPLEAIAFLARSDNRVQVLRALADEARTRQHLREELPVSRTTLARILNEFEERDWVARNGREYATTPAADAILARFVPLLETVEGIQNLGEAIDWLPPPARAVEFRHFRDADIMRATTENPAEPYDRGLELIRGTETYRGLNSTSIPRYVDALRDWYVEGSLESEAVIGASHLETLREDPARAAPWHDIAEDVWVYDGRVPIDMHVLDEVVLIWLAESREDGVEIHGILECENPAVLSWANSLYEEYRAQAEPLDPATLPEP